MRAISEYVPFAVVSRGCRRTAQKPELHAMLECYFDDSADPQRGKYYACGGLMGTSEQWDWVEGRWSYEVRDLKEPFRTTDCETGHGQFADWPKSKRDDLVARLVGVIRDQHIFGFASIVPVQPYQKAFPDCGKHDPFLLAVTQTVMNMAHLADQMNEDVGLWFESGQQNGAIATIFNLVQHLDWKPARRLRAIYLDSKQLRPLQCADLIAREAFKHSENLGIRNTRIPVRRLSDALYFIRWTDEALGFLAENGGPQNLELLSSWDECHEAPKLEMFWQNF